MDPLSLHVDERLAEGRCSFCGAVSDTRDHVPSKALLDEPYPNQLPVVPACRNCNSSFSLGEQYLACFVECVVSGTAQPVGLQRGKVARILAENPNLRRTIENSQRMREGRLLWQPEADRVRNVLLKLAHGHAAYELYPQREHPITLSYAPFLNLGEAARLAFEDRSDARVLGWPEIGTRAFFRVAAKAPEEFESHGQWVVVQPGRYRYAVFENSGVVVKMVLSEYLFCEVVWEN